MNGNAGTSRRAVVRGIAGTIGASALGSAARAQQPAAATDTPRPSSGSPKERLLTWLHSLAGNHLISAQQTHSNFSEITAFISATGKHPGMVVTDYWMDASPYFDASGNAACIAHWNAGGLVGISNFLPNPAGGGAGNGTPVSASAVLTPGTATHNALLASLDQSAAALREFKNRDIPVIYRTLLEMDIPGGFWWGEQNFNGTQFGQLWRLIHYYLTVTKGLDHLIWMFAVNGGPGTYTYVGDDVVDGVGMDAYTNTPGSSLYRRLYNKVHSQAPSKFMALTEFGSGGPGFNEVNPNFDAWTLVNLVRTTMRNIVYINCWTGWDWSKYRNVAAALSDPYVLNRDNLNRPM